MTQKQIPHDPQAWVDARRPHHLSHAQVQMARELGLEPRASLFDGEEAR